MKFSKPRILLENNYPDLDISQPALLKRLVDEIIYPPENSSISDYIDYRYNDCVFKKKA